MKALSVIVLIAVSIRGSLAQDVKGTYWSSQSDGGGCQVPESAYTITDAVALGQGHALGNLIYRPGLCGQVVDVSCNSNITFPAVIVSTCNIGSDSCGIDMIGKTWNKATNNAQPGIVGCSVALSTQNPLPGSAHQCFHRTGSAQDGYSRILGVLNTGGEIPASATLAGRPGTFSNGAWFEFNAGGQNLFVDDAVVVFTYESGQTSTFNLSNCTPPSSVQIFS